MKWLFSIRPLVLQTKQTHQHDQQSRKSACALGRVAPPERALLQDSSMVAPAADVVASAGLDLLDVAEVDRGSGQCRCLTCLEDLALSRKKLGDLVPHGSMVFNIFQYPFHDLMTGR